MNRPISRLLCDSLVGALGYFIYINLGLITAIIFITIYIVILIKINTYIENILSLLVIVTFFLNGYSYFNFNLPKENITCRIIEDRGYYYYGNTNGKTIKVDNVTGLDMGKIYFLTGDFRKINNGTKGVVGEFKVTKHKDIKEDYIYKSYKLKDEIYKYMLNNLGYESANAYMAICYGDTRYMNYEKMEFYNQLGILHVISVSGFHVALIYGVIMPILGQWMGLTILLIYTIFTGAQAATVRAFLMIAVLILGRKINKNYDNFSALYFSAFLLILIKPYYIVDTGFLLSYLGMAGIFALYDKIKRALYRLPNFINESLAMTISASFLTVPFVIMKFKNYSLGGLICNIILMPFYTLIVIIGNFFLVFYEISFLRQPLMWVCSSIFFIINTIESLLINIIPKPLQFTYLDGIIILFLYLAYMFIKRGYNSLKYITIGFSILILIESYNIVPQMNFINVGNFDVIELKYKNRNVLVCGDKLKLKNVYEKLQVYRIYDEFQDNLILNIGKDSKIIFTKQEKNIVVTIMDKDYITKVYVTEEKNTPIINKESCCVKYVSRDRSYDIIEIKKNSEYNKKGHYYESYNIVNGKVWHNYIH